MSNGHNGQADPEVVESQVAVGALPLVGDTEIDTQVATARRFPRSITRFIQKAQEMATLNAEIAGACIYAIPRDGKTIEGPSARFAEVMASAWGNMRAEGKTLGDDGQYVTARGTAWDVENNVAIAFEVKRRITGRNGQTYNADMITVTGNAAASIALRNAILKAVPTPFWKPVYNACRKVVAGDAKTFATRRDNMLHEFAIMGVTEERLCSAFGLKGKLDITLEHMATLTGCYTAIKDGDTTIEEAFPDNQTAAPQPAQRKSQQPVPAAATAPASQQPSAPSAPAAPVPPVAPTAIGAIGIIVEVLAREGGAWMLKLDTGFRCATRDPELVAAAQTLRDKKTRVELGTVPAPSGPKFAPVLQEITPVADEARS